MKNEQQIKSRIKFLKESVLGQQFAEEDKRGVLVEIMALNWVLHN